MKSFKGKLMGIGVIALLFALVGGYVAFKYYDYVFSKTVIGEVIGVERVNTNETIITSGTAIPASQIFSFAVAIKDTKGEIHTASSEDRQWAVVQKGQCAEVVYYPYPPWDLNRAKTFHNARLVRLFECPKADEPKGAPAKAEPAKAPVPGGPAAPAMPAAPEPAASGQPAQ